MPDTGKNAITTYTYLGSALFIDFDYLEEADILVEVAEDLEQDFIPQTLGTHYTLESLFSGVLPPPFVVFVSPYEPDVGHIVRLTRQTAHATPAVTYVDGQPVRATSLNANQKQLRFYAEEIEDLNE